MDASTSSVLYAFGLTLLAGLATGVGSAIAYFAKRTNTAFLSFSLAFSGGVMLYVSFTEILVKAEHSLTLVHGAGPAGWITIGSFLGGMIFMGIIDRFVPSAENPHEIPTVSDLTEMQAGHRPAVPTDHRLMRMGLFSALAIGIHNFPEGLATFLAALDHAQVGLAIAVAIAIHNIPEGVSVSVPIYFATGSKKQAFLYSFLSGVSEPIGALVGYGLLQAVATPNMMGIVFAGVAGIMVYISLDELLPTAREYGRGHQVLYGIIGGIAVMAVSLLLLR